MLCQPPAHRPEKHEEATTLGFAVGVVAQHQYELAIASGPCIVHDCKDAAVPETWRGSLALWGHRPIIHHDHESSTGSEPTWKEAHYLTTKGNERQALCRIFALSSVPLDVVVGAASLAQVHFSATTVGHRGDQLGDLPQWVYDDYPQPESGWCLRVESEH
eukprot:2904790-Amphidinium_carterae.1